MYGNWVLIYGSDHGCIDNFRKFYWLWIDLWMYWNICKINGFYMDVTKKTMNSGLPMPSKITVSEIYVKYGI